MKIIPGGLYEAKKFLYSWRAGDVSVDIFAGDRFILLNYEFFRQSKLRIVTILDKAGICEIRVWNSRLSAWVTKIA